MSKHKWSNTRSYVGRERAVSYGPASNRYFGKAQKDGPYMGNVQAHKGSTANSGMHTEMASLMPADLQARLRHTIGEAMHTGVTSEAYPIRCPLCSKTIRVGSPGGMSFHDPLTGCCTKVNACSKRRAELDDETIEYLGLIPRGRESEAYASEPPSGKSVLPPAAGQARAPTHEIGRGISRRSGVVGQVVARRDNPPSTSRRESEC